jgi:hypothetical protein
MSGGTVFTCKECGTSGDYEDMPKGMDPRPGVFRAICRDCIDTIKKEQAGAQIFEKAKRSFRRAGPSSQAAQGAALSSPQTCSIILGQLLIEPLTPDEISRTTGKVLNTVRARITNMKDFGYVRDTGNTRLATDANRHATVWEITTTGREWLSNWRAAA